MTEIRKQKELERTERECLTWALPVPAQHCWPRPSHRLPPARRMARVCPTRACTRRPPPPSLPTWLLPGAPRRRHGDALDPLCLSPLTLEPLPLLCSLSHARPSAAVAAARRSRSHRLPLALSPCLRAPPPRPEALRRATRLGRPWSASITAVSISGRRGSPSPPHRL